MLPLLQAINAKIIGTPAIVAAFPGWRNPTTGLTYPAGYYRDVAPEQAPLPFLVSTVIASPATYRYGGIQRTEPSIQFAAFGIGQDAVFGKLKILTDAFDEFLFTLSAGHVVNMTRAGDPIPVHQDDKDEQGRDVWQWAVTYDYVLSPT
jgi:hypothetical protein